MGGYLFAMAMRCLRRSSVAVGKLRQMVTRCHASRAERPLDGELHSSASGRYVYGVEAWTDMFGTWRRDLLAKHKAGMDVRLEIEEGRILFVTLKLREEPPRPACSARYAEHLHKAQDPAALVVVASSAAAAKAAKADLTRSPRYPLQADRLIARAGAWYEMMPRSQGSVAGRHGTFDDCINRLPEMAAMGFDVLYFTPIHPIGRTNRKGRNNSLALQPAIPAAPMPSARSKADTMPCIPSSERSKISGACYRLAPSREWRWRSISPSNARRIIPGSRSTRNGSSAGRDGSIQYAENPPKKYEDIVNPDFYGADGEGLWRGVTRRRAVLGSPGRAHLSRRQSAHQAASVLGMVDPGSAVGRSECDFSVGGLYTTEGHEGARQARL